MVSLFKRFLTPPGGQRLLFTNRDLFRLFLPLIIEQFLVVLAGFTDSLMAAALGEAAVSGISLIDNIMVLLILVFVALATGGSVIMGQYLGHREQERAREAGRQLIWVAGLISLVLMGIFYGSRSFILHRLYGDIAPDVLRSASDYLDVIGLTIPFIALFRIVISVILIAVVIIVALLIQLEEMIDTLLNYMKLNNFEIKEQLVKKSISRLIIDFSKYAEVTAKIFKRNVHTNIELPEDIEVPFNEQLIHRSFENLLSNAIRYTKENDLIEINAYTKALDDSNFIILEIKDTGYGVAKKDLDYIFDLFYRGTNSRQEEGMGIGLAVVKNIMDTHGWQISVESQKKKGSCFTIKIPY